LLISNIKAGTKVVSDWCNEPEAETDLDAQWYSTLWYSTAVEKHGRQSL
jgi:hypothetical protein